MNLWSLTYPQSFAVKCHSSISQRGEKGRSSRQRQLKPALKGNCCRNGNLYMLQTQHNPLQKAGEDGLCINNIETAMAPCTLEQPGAVPGGLRWQRGTEPTWLVPRVSSHRDRAKPAHPFLSVPLPSIAW